MDRYRVLHCPTTGPPKAQSKLRGGGVLCICHLRTAVCFVINFLEMGNLTYRKENNFNLTLKMLVIYVKVLIRQHVTVYLHPPDR